MTPAMLWKFREHDAPPPPENLPDLAESLDISPRLAHFLWQRGMRGRDAVNAFLNPSLCGLAPLESWPGLQKAASLLAAGLLQGKKLCIWGDYDVDGISATALILDFLRAHGLDALRRIPDRLSEGYGLNTEGIAAVAGQGADILLTVDCGISDNEAVAYAKSLGMTVIITDHHLPSGSLPEADATVNPRLLPCPCPALSGVGVAFFLAAALNVELVAAGKSRVDVRDLLDLVALGTLADVVDLNGQNRILVKNGLLKVACGARVGLAALKSACNFSPGAALGAGQVVFALAPRINAAGRLGSGETALKLFLSRDRTEAAALASELSRLNSARREEENRIFKEAAIQAEEEAGKGRLGLVLYSSGWHPGVVGIVAARIAEKLHRPTVILSEVEGRLKGSGRSVPGFDLHDAFSACSGLLLGYGGHKMAAGMSIRAELLEEFRMDFHTVVMERLGKAPAEAECSIDSELPFAEADFHFLKELEMLQPFGAGNVEPLFASLPVKVKRLHIRGDLTSLELQEEHSGLTRTAKVWRRPPGLQGNIEGKRIRIAYTPWIDRYNGTATVELRLKDWKEL
ncbi:MAG: single-stranded-DNA-specific exonuclease RecJ [Desulfovibrio sp.]|jgi:single-stranded-DNA-specific exonuclease|nr:single-stranded-DNA-specific exonuclease RecJ [Desulfovibrio sp.]